MYPKHPIADTYYTELVAAQRQKFIKLIKKLAFK
jgi:hypothetical protein